MKSDEQTLCCPKDWEKRYEDYMVLHKIPYRKVKAKVGQRQRNSFGEDESRFVLPRKYRPHAWKIELK